MYDCAIIGSGPAGVSAALTLKALSKNIIWFGNKGLSAKVKNAEKIRNYPGLSNVTGMEMQAAFLAQIEDMGLEITEKTVTAVCGMGDYYGILCDQEIFEAKTVILTIGVDAVKPIKGELEFMGRGVSYCATCDGFLYKGKKIAVICTSKELEHEIKYLCDLAAEVNLCPLYKDVEISADNLKIITDMPIEIYGVQRADKLIFKDKELSVDGIFMLKAAVVPSVLVAGLQAADGHVTVDRACKTNLKGCFAAGDCTGRPYQYAKAVGEGNVAAHSANEYLAAQK
ncbi:MAG: NAD(P)/FAD-dependent oxidoreductase [Clostridiales bacterium]|nr:NAD(P)/FAD-dependent oxidoreductase [Clostridiales bacterium]